MRYELRQEDNGYRLMVHLYRVDDDGLETLLGSDGGEPEDQSFGRDWAWVPVELNRLAGLAEEHRMMREANGMSLQHTAEELSEVRRRLGAKIVELQGYLENLQEHLERWRQDSCRPCWLRVEGPSTVQNAPGLRGVIAMCQDALKQPETSEGEREMAWAVLTLVGVEVC